MSYTLLPGDAASATWQGASAYTPPNGSATDAAWAPTDGVEGVGAGILEIQASGTAWHGVSGTGQGHIPITGAGDATFTDTSAYAEGNGLIPLAGGAQAAHGVSGVASGQIGLSATAVAVHGVSGGGAGDINCTPAGSAAHGVSGGASGVIPMASAGAAIHERYELRGEAREGGVLVNRRVRAYLRSTGALVGESDTVVGKFNVNTGFSQAEHYVIPIDLSEFASDWLPPAANRIVPVLAYDA